MGKILIVDDEPNIRNILNVLLKKENYQVLVASSGEEGVKTAEQEDFDLAVLDINLPGINGIETMRQIKQIHSNMNFVFITAHGTFSLAVEAIKNGGFNFVSKPFDNEEILGIINAAYQAKLLKDRVLALESQLRPDEPFKEIIGQSASLMKVLRLAEKVAPTEMNLLITGESGTGKELLVRAIHRLSSRREKQIIPVNCAAIPPNLFESEFFGHIKGAFTGAINYRTGKFKEADGGTLFLDEIAEMPLEFQAKLLRALESGEITVVGENRPIKCNVRVIAATNRNLPELIEEKLFREDLYYRLNIFQLELPPLRERKDDIPLLASYFLKAHKHLNFSPEAIEAIRNHSWFGNIRELKNEMQRISILADDVILSEHLSFKGNSKNCSEYSLDEGFSLSNEIERIEKEYYQAAMKKAGNNKAMAAKLLGVSYRTFNYQWDKYQQEY
jgi:DNA-binding NtrC family response regulator